MTAVALRRTKIVVTLGPALDDPEILRQVILAGADVFRARRRWAVDLFDPDRLQPSPAGVGRTGLKDTT